ncbi:hypothetical protein B5M09_011578 [Aphanomyces astaci]|uniref:Uncharacterized protein n=1 Tax=Aphanomyces astaci TaxID=112090 RepID=A0A425CT08_APHAT|nr:hypothetical protein B5M09_011578 [Aphanomyces astaci]
MLQLAGYTAEKVAAAVPVITSFEHTLAGVDLIKLGTFDKTEVLLKNTTLDNLSTIVEYKLIHPLLHT